jgi:hypothetical protein
VTKHEFYDALTDYCRQTNASITSLGRTVKHNAAVGGVSNSWHLSWRAADVVYDAVLPRQTRIDAAARFGLLNLIEGDHDHLQPLGSPVPTTATVSGTPRPRPRTLPKGVTTWGE